MFCINKEISLRVPGLTCLICDKQEEFPLPAVIKIHRTASHSYRMAEMPTANAFRHFASERRWKQLAGTTEGYVCPQCQQAAAVTQRLLTLATPEQEP